MTENELSIEEQQSKLGSLVDEYMLQFQLVLQKTLQEQINKHNITDDMLQTDTALYDLECVRSVEEGFEEYVLRIKPGYLSPSGYSAFYYLAKVDFKGGPDKDMIQILTPSE